MNLEEWAEKAMRRIRLDLRMDTHWSEKLGDPRCAVHLGVFVEPFLSLVLDGSKSVESRFSTRRCAPFHRVGVGDIMLLKGASGPVKGICEVAKAWYFDLRSTPIAKVRERFGRAICADDDFWRSRQEADYATLLKVQAVRELPPFSCPKRDRRGWVVFPASAPRQLALPVS
jgi:hypothetical protein